MSFADLAVQVVFQRDCVVVLRVARAVHQRDRAAARRRHQRTPQGWLRIELTKIPLAKGRPLAWIVTEPLSQCRARPDVLEPRANVQDRLREAAWPQTFDKDASAIGWRDRLVRTFQLQHELAFSDPYRAPRIYVSLGVRFRKR